MIYVIIINNYIITVIIMTERLRNIIEDIPKISNNEEFWILPSWWVNIPFNNKRYAFIIYKNWKVLSKYKWRDHKWHNSKVVIHNKDSMQNFINSINDRVNKITKGTWSINQDFIKITYKYFFNQNHINNNSSLDLNRLRESIINYQWNDTASFLYQGKQLKFVRLNIWIKVFLGDTSEEILYFSSKHDLNIRLWKWLNQEIWLNRKKIGKEFSYIWDRLNLKDSIWRNSIDRINSSNEQVQENNLLSFSKWEYSLNNSSNPITYLLVRNDNSWAYYCLSFVQEAYDIMFGYWSAKKIWLYKKRHAEWLNFIWNDKVKVYDSNFPDLKPWMIIRMWRFFGNNTHIWIVLPNNKIWHIVWDIFYVDDSINDISWGSVKQVIEPLEDLRFDLQTKETNTRFNKWLWLERIWYKLKSSRALKISTANQAYIDETIYQMNKNKFILSRWRWDTKMILKSKTRIKIPYNWYK